mmetsp:Transcript_10594/g.14506  ORF Transcript_10594/g.14506 Transcript_10594/m.14506 type:complete len:135 (+) Transcript_10594:75-479(+)
MSWFFKSDLRYKGDIGWTAYADDESEIIEEAYQNGKTIVKVNDKYKIDLEKMFQYRITDTTKQREVKREAPKKKQKVQHNNNNEDNILVGKAVWVVYDSGNDEVLGVYAFRDDAKARERREDNKNVQVVKQYIQ